ncbi:MAG: hypothetical protein M3Z25_20555 [Actinomycetota bacterium]|nr:hypothetical protein [Actinomycetota bacterium]
MSGTWEPDRAQRDAVWELYVELVTRIAVVPLQPGHGVLREALTSLYQLFRITREILRKYGPAVACPPRKSGQFRFGYLAVWMLNAALRPVLAQWHPELQRWKSPGRPLGRRARAGVGARRRAAGGTGGAAAAVAAVCGGSGGGV